MRASWRPSACPVSASSRGIALLVAVVLFSIAPLAYADPPDPLWMGGMWDDDDFDSVVAVVKSTEGPLDADLPAFGPLEPTPGAPSVLPEWRPLPLLPVRWPENRAPPDA
jgi:hypothetical protein